jgi:type II secretory pathway component PulM
MSAVEPRALAATRRAGVSARERRTIAIGAALIVAALLASFVVLPFARRWGEREAAIDARADRLARLQALVRDAPRLAVSVQSAERALAARPQRVIGARSAALAASAVQSLLQGYAAESGVQVSRVDVASAPDTAGGLAAIPATLTATGDVHGLAALLERVEHGPRALEIVDLAVQSVRGPRGESLLQFSVGVRAPFAEVE